MPHDPYAALRYPDFWLYLVGFLLGIIGEQILEVVVGWDLYLRTNNALTLGWVGLVSAAPVVLLALPAGHLADRSNRRWVMILSQIGWAICALWLGLISHQKGPIGTIYTLLFFTGVAKAIGGPARSALLPMLVPERSFSNAVTWNSTGFQTAAMLGPALGGFIIVGLGAPAAYIAAALGPVAFAVMLLGVKTAGAPKHREPATLQSLAAGVKYVFATPIILATITLDLFAVLLGGATYLLPIFAKDILHVGATGFGWLRAAPAIGALVMAMIVAHSPPMKRAGRSMLWAVTGFGVATIVFGLSKNFWLSLFMLFLTGAFDNISVVVRHTLVQVLTPDSMRGRVSAVNNVFIGASNELGGFESGLTARLFRAVPSVVAGGIGTIVVVILVALGWPQVRAFGSLLDAKAEPLEEPRGFEVDTKPEN